MKKYFIMLFIFFGVCLTFSGTPPLKISMLLNGVKTNEIWFSPCNGTQDDIAISLEIRSLRLVMGWSVSIFNSSNQIVWLRSGEKSRDVPLDPGEFWKKLWTKKENVSVPDAITWDGMSDSGVVLPEGRYFAVASAWDEMKNTAVSETDCIILEITPPQGSLSINDNIFYPNETGKRRLFFITQDLSTNGFWRAEIRNEEGVVIKNWEWGCTPPKMLEWDGRGNDGTSQPEGSYDYIVYGWDQAGNKTIIPLSGIYLSRKVYSVFLTPERSEFSPGAVKPLNELRFFPALSVTNGLLSWNLIIKDKNLKILRDLRGETLPPVIIWDGRDEKMKTIPDGSYKCFLSCNYAEGNTVYSEDNCITAVGSNPELSISAAPLPFSPDGSGINNLLNINFITKSHAALKKWKIVIFDPEGRPFKTFEGQTEPSCIIKWNGRSDNGELVESAENYRLSAYASDVLGNQAEKELDGGINVDILAEKTDRGYQIRINNIDFDFAKAGLKKNKTFILDRVADILRKYSNYRVEIQGHTDNIGSMKKNLALSSERARNVYNYLIGKGISKDRLTYKGCSFSFPIADNSTGEGRKRNRRVEFILLKE